MFSQKEWSHLLHSEHSHLPSTFSSSLCSPQAGVLSSFSGHFLYLFLLMNQIRLLVNTRNKKRISHRSQPSSVRIFECDPHLLWESLTRRVLPFDLCGGEKVRYQIGRQLRCDDSSKEPWWRWRWKFCWTEINRPKLKLRSSLVSVSWVSRDARYELVEKKENILAVIARYYNRLEYTGRICPL